MKIEICDNTYWISLLAIIGVSILSIVLSVTNNISNKNKMIGKLIEDGFNPMQIHCALDDPLGRQPTCLVLATKSKVLNKPQ